MICSLSLLLSRGSFASLVAIVVVGLSGCVQPSARLSPEPISTTVNREKLALDLQERGELAEALIQWTILSTIEPANRDYENRVTRTKQLIDNKSKSLMLDGMSNLRRGAREAARLSFLKVLALNPRNKEALEHLRQLAMPPSTESKNGGKS
ncbi:hypothetical protein [Nitrosospira briensis]|uniref:hypothetical protein n=1 Tax=Nitrosospira briensis TaxID=35799 RepID=UPI0008E7E0C5|nr:hypothetical protein [Nitrosospira briensis]SFO11441.1 hypothetical protein SAMN05216332_105113 [Nitrosospira briensis]